MPHRYFLDGTELWRLSDRPVLKHFGYIENGVFTRVESVTRYHPNLWDALTQNVPEIFPCSCPRHRDSLVFHNLRRGYAG